VAAERVDPEADDRDAAPAVSSTGAKAYVNPAPPGASISTSSIGIPIRKRAGSRSVSRASTRTWPASST